MILQFHVNEDTAIVTGASQGIGEAIAKRFADDDVNIAICSRSRGRFQPVVDDLKDDGGTVDAAECDVTDRERVFEFGDFDVLVNNAENFQSPFEDLSEKAWKTIVDIDLHGTVHFTQAAGEVMCEGDGGYVVNIVSDTRLEGDMPDMSQYGAAKAALKNLSETLAGEWNEYGIQTNCIAPVWSRHRVWSTR